MRVVITVNNSLNSYVNTFHTYYFKSYQENPAFKYSLTNLVKKPNLKTVCCNEQVCIVVVILLTTLKQNKQPSFPCFNVINREYGPSEKV